MGVVEYGSPVIVVSWAEVGDDVLWRNPHHPKSIAAMLLRSDEGVGWVVLLAMLDVLHVGIEHGAEITAEVGETSTPGYPLGSLPLPKLPKHEELVDWTAMWSEIPYHDRVDVAGED